MKKYMMLIMVLMLAVTIKSAWSETGDFSTNVFSYNTYVTPIDGTDDFSKLNYNGFMSQMLTPGFLPYITLELSETTLSNSWPRFHGDLYSTTLKNMNIPVADLDEDGTNEILLGSSNNVLKLYHYNITINKLDLVDEYTFADFIFFGSPITVYDTNESDGYLDILVSMIGSGSPRSGFYHMKWDGSSFTILKNTNSTYCPTGGSIQCADTSTDTTYCTYYLEDYPSYSSGCVGDSRAIGGSSVYNILYNADTKTPSSRDVFTATADSPKMMQNQRPIISDVDNDGSLEIVYVYFGTYSDDLKLTIFDLATNAEECYYNLDTNIAYPLYYNSTPIVSVHDIDGLGTNEEIFVSYMDGNTNRIRILSSACSSLFVLSTASSTEYGHTGVAWVGDPDNDGNQDYMSFVQISDTSLRVIDIDDSLSSSSQDVTIDGDNPPQMSVISAPFHYYDEDSHSLDDFSVLSTVGVYKSNGDLVQSFEFLDLDTASAQAVDLNDDGFLDYMFLEDDKLSIVYTSLVVDNDTDQEINFIADDVLCGYYPFINPYSSCEVNQYSIINYTVHITDPDSQPITWTYDCVDGDGIGDFVIYDYDTNDTFQCNYSQRGEFKTKVYASTNNLTYTSAEYNVSVISESGSGCIINNFCEFNYGETMDNCPFDCYQCNNGLDDDNDGLTDYIIGGASNGGDPECTWSGDNDESTKYDFACGDYKDNDYDDLVDYPDDPGCDSIYDTDETDSENNPQDNNPGFTDVFEINESKWSGQGGNYVSKLSLNSYPGVVVRWEECDERGYRRTSWCIAKIVFWDGLDSITNTILENIKLVIIFLILFLLVVIASVSAYKYTRGV